MTVTTPAPDPRTTALLVLDCQQGILASLPGPADSEALLSRVAGDITVRKTRFGALSTTDLDRRLRDRGITTLVIAGVTTSGAVLSTVTDAADRDYRLHVLSDCVTDPDPQAHHVLMTGVFPRLAHIIDTAELRSLLRDGHPGRAETGGAAEPGRVG